VSRRRKKALPPEPREAVIDDLAHDGRGVAHVEGKTVFIDGALPGETVLFRYTRLHGKFDEGRVEEIRQASPQRVTPGCEYFGLCGGCSLQHLDPAEQIARKQKRLLDDLIRIGKVEPESVLAPLTGPSWGYRQKARLGVRYVRKKERVLVGFRERHGRYLADMRHCEILHPRLGPKLGELADLIGQLACREKIAQIEVAIGDDGAALIFRNLVEPGDDDRARLIAWGREQDFQIYLQPKGPDSVYYLWPEQPLLEYHLPDHDLTIGFEPGDFTQVNPEINRKMVRLALDLLGPEKTDRVLELFCGLGNFSLPLARLSGEVVAVEGDSALVERARRNAARNGLDNVQYHVANLFDDVSGLPWLRNQHYDKLLLDPPRSGALEVLPEIARVGAERIVYVSCNPATLARDAGVLVNELGYRLEQAGVMDMFPHTAHVESIAVFVK
jgi:23S rRNA (uracil1939-C5)-methyltransferase